MQIEHLDTFRVKTLNLQNCFFFLMLLEDLILDMIMKEKKKVLVLPLLIKKGN